MAGDYGGYKAILAEARELARQERERGEIACPRCGAILQINSAGIGDCPLGHYQTTNVRRRVP